MIFEGVAVLTVLARRSALMFGGSCVLLQMYLKPKNVRLAYDCSYAENSIFFFAFSLELCH